MATALTEPAAEKTVQSENQKFLLRAIDWATYRKVTDALAGRSLRLAYDGWNLELMTKSYAHSRFSRLIGQLVAVLADEVGMTRSCCGDMTCDREDLERGIEPDECFYLVNEPLVRDKEKIDLTVDPPPDLGAEVDITRSSLNRLGIYAAIKVPEVWRFDGHSATIYQLQPNGQYAVAERSRYFTFLTGADLARFLLMWTHMDEASLIREFRTWVQEQIARAQ